MNFGDSISWHLLCQHNFVPSIHVNGACVSCDKIIIEFHANILHTLRNFIAIPRENASIAHISVLPKLRCVYACVTYNLYA